MKSEEQGYNPDCRAIFFGKTGTQTQLKTLLGFVFPPHPPGITLSADMKSILQSAILVFHIPKFPDPHAFAESRHFYMRNRFLDRHLFSTYKTIRHEDQGIHNFCCINTRIHLSPDTSKFSSTL